MTAQRGDVGRGIGQATVRARLVWVLTNEYEFMHESAGRIVDSLLPEVARFAAEELRAAAEDLRSRGVGPEVFVVDDRADNLIPEDRIR